MLFVGEEEKKRNGTLPVATGWVGRQRSAAALRFGRRHPVSFVREVAAALAGKPDKADWRKCELGRDGEERAAEALRERFSEFDIMAN